MIIIKCVQSQFTLVVRTGFQFVCLPREDPAGRSRPINASWDRRPSGHLVILLPGIDPPVGSVIAYFGVQFPARLLFPGPRRLPASQEAGRWPASSAVRFLTMPSFGRWGRSRHWSHPCGCPFCAASQLSVSRVDRPDKPSI